MRPSLHSLRAAALAALLASAAAAQQPRADLLLLNGRVLTVDATDRVAQAVAIAGNRIVAVGSNADAERAAGPGVRRVDLAGRTVTPGLLDAHAHFSGGGADRLFVIDLSYPNVKNMADVAAAIREKAAMLPKGTWITGRGWDEGKLAEKRLITARDIDAASPDHPVYLTQTTGHYGVANSLAMRLAGVSKDTREPPAGTIDRNPDGSPTGVLKEGAQGLVRRLVPPRTADENERGIRELVKAFNAEGMTGLKDPGINAQTWDLYRKVERDGALISRLGDFTVNRFATEEATGYPTLCKGRFSVPGRTGYLLEEPTSLDVMAVLGELRAAGVAALKIEGRQRGRAYVAAAGDNMVTAVDTTTLKEVARIPVGQVPKRNGTALLRK